MSGDYIHTGTFPAAISSFGELLYVTKIPVKSVQLFYAHLTITHAYAYRAPWHHVHFSRRLMNRSVSSNYLSPCFVPTQIFVATIAFLLPSAEHSTVEADKKVHVGKEGT